MIKSELLKSKSQGFSSQEKKKKKQISFLLSLSPFYCICKRWWVLTDLTAAVIAQHLQVKPSPCTPGTHTMTYVDYISVKPRENNQETNQKVKKNSVLRKSRIQGGGKGSCCLMGSRGSTQRSTAKLVPRRERCHPRVGAGDVCSVPTLGSHGSHDACKTPVNTRPWPPAADILPTGQKSEFPCLPGSHLPFLRPAQSNLESY